MSKVVMWRRGQRTLLAIIATAVMVAGSASVARAALVITDPSFETPVLADGDSAPGGAAGWQTFAPSGGNGILDPAAAIGVLQPTDGDNVAVISGTLPGHAFGTGVHFYDMGAPQAGSYTISADMALESDATGGFEFWIQAFDTLGGPLGWDGAVDFTASHGNTFRDFPYANAPEGGLQDDSWRTVTLAFSVDPSDPFLTAGDQNLRLVITNQGSDASGAPTNLLVDNVQISFTPAAVPEPSTMLLASCGIVGLGIARWRRKKAS